MALLALLLWTMSPFPDRGLGGALHVATELWLLAHGAELRRTETLSGTPAPIGLTPLLLTALPVWLLYRAARRARPATGADPGALGRRRVRWDAVCCLSAGYLLVGTVAAVSAAFGPMPVAPLSATMWLPLTAVCATAVGVWTGSGRRPAVPEPLRVAAVGTGVLCGGGAALAAGSLAWHSQAAELSFSQLTGVWSGRLAVLLLAVSLAPNAAVWGAAYGLGPGFALGAGSTVGPLAAVGHPQLPSFPLLAAVPAGGTGEPLTMVAALALPLAAGLAMAWRVARTTVTWSAAASTAALGALACGAAMALLAALAGGPMGSGALAQFGPNWWLTGAAAVAWTAVPAVSAALGLRALGIGAGLGAGRRWPVLRLRRRAGRRAAGQAVVPAWAGEFADFGNPDDNPDDTDDLGLSQIVDSVPGGFDDWHSPAARRRRWEALKRASGGVTPDDEHRGPRRDEHLWDHRWSHSHNDPQNYPRGYLYDYPYDHLHD